MKNIILVLFFIQITVAQNKVSLIDQTQNERLFTGQIDGKYAITLYLKKKNFSQDHLRVFSVEGWYYYESQKKKIPLVGICNQGYGMGEFTLYNFSDPTLNKKVLDFNYDGFLGDAMEKFLNMKGYQEKFYFNIDDKENSVWKNDKKTLSLDFFTDNVTVYEENQVLQLKSKNDTKSIFLSKLGITDRNTKLIKSISTNYGTKVLLKYDYGSNFNIQSRCGAGSEIGYLILEFNKEFSFQKMDRLAIESCFDSINYEEVKSANKNELKFKITDANDKSVIKTLDLQNISIK